MDEKRRSTWVLLAGVGLLVAGLLAFLAPAPQPDPPLRVYFASTGGGVLFDHGDHAGLDLTCSYCHHEMLSEERTMSCTVCHHVESFAMVAWEDPDQADLHMEFASSDDEAMCLGCHGDHDALDEPVAPATRTSCAQCHEAEHPMLVAGHSCDACHAIANESAALGCRQCHGDGEGEAPTCATCHAEEGYTAGMLAHAELTAIEGHTCASCHIPTRRGTAMHARCNRCHLDLEQGTYFTRSREDEASVCKTCHLMQ